MFVVGGIACSSAAPAADGGGLDGSVDGGDPFDSGTDGGGLRDSGVVDAGKRGLCGSCRSGAEDCEAALDCREVAAGFGHCASFQPTCPGSQPDVSFVEVSFFINCRTAPRSFPFCQVRARLDVADAVLFLEGSGFEPDGGVLLVSGRSVGTQSARAWNSIAVGCYPPQYSFPNDSCLTHSGNFATRFELHDGGVRLIEFYAGSSQLPSQSYIAGIVSMVTAAQAFFDGGL